MSNTLKPTKIHILNFPKQKTFCGKLWEMSLSKRFSPLHFYRKDFFGRHFLPKNVCRNCAKQLLWI
jgi:hypothetical protein